MDARQRVCLPRPLTRGEHGPGAHQRPRAAAGHVANGLGLAGARVRVHLVSIIPSHDVALQQLAPARARDWRQGAGGGLDRRRRAAHPPSCGRGRGRRRGRHEGDVQVAGRGDARGEGLAGCGPAEGRAGGDWAAGERCAGPGRAQTRRRACRRGGGQVVGRTPARALGSRTGPRPRPRRTRQRRPPRRASAGPGWACGP